MSVFILTNSVLVSCYSAGDVGVRRGGRRSVPVTLLTSVIESNGRCEFLSLPTRSLRSLVIRLLDANDSAAKGGIASRHSQSLSKQNLTPSSYTDMPVMDSIKLERDPTNMDTMTYASLAAIPWSVAKNNQRPGVPEVELTPLDLVALGSINR